MTSNQSYNEPQLLIRIATGDESAFREVVDHYQSVIFTIAFRLSGNKEISEDIVQDVFLKMWSNRASLPQMENFGGWLYTIAKNILLNAISSFSREKLYQREIASQSSLMVGNEEHFIDDRDFNMILSKTVQKLPEKQRLAYILIKEQGLTRQEAAQRLNVSPETIKSNLDLAMRFLRAQLIFLFADKQGSLFILLFSDFFL